MVSSCIVPGCRAATEKKGGGISYYRLPTKDAERCRLWLQAAKNPRYGETSPADSVRNLRVCSLHFRPEDFQRSYFVDNTSESRFQDDNEEMGQTLGQFRSVGIQVNVPETTKRSSQHYIVDEEAIMQLMQNCPICKRKCRCRKRIHGISVVFYQGCYFCDYQRKWASQPEASTISIRKKHARTKKKPPKDKVS